MAQYSPEEIQKKYDALPQSVKAVYEGGETAEVIQQIGKNHKLMLDKLGELADETGLVLLGITHPKDYINHLSSRLGTSQEESKKIAEEVNDKIFRRIREELKKIHGIEEAEAAPAAKPGITVEREPKISPVPLKQFQIKTEVAPKAEEPAAPAVKVVPLKPFMPQVPPKLPEKSVPPEVKLPVSVPKIKPHIIITEPAPSATQSAAHPKTETAPEMMLPQAPAAAIPPSMSPAAAKLAPPPAEPAVAAKPQPIAPQAPTSPFEQKLDEETITRSAPIKYTGRDPYREPIE